MGRTLLTGATGTLGTALRPKLLAAGHDVRATSRSPPADGEPDADTGPSTYGDLEWVRMDLADGTGVEQALEDVDVVIHTASAPQGDTEAVDVDGTERLLDAAADAGVSNFLYPSIVGVDEIPFTYYEHKLAAERAVESSPVPSTIIRATQFHSFVADLLDTVARLPVWPLPTKFEVQPVAVTDVADSILEYTTTEAHGRVPNVGGPDVRTLGDLARDYRERRGLRRFIVRLPVPGSVAGGFRAGHNTCPDRAVGTVTWESWLDDQYGNRGQQSSERTATPS
jgi:uncharacterized protein YbjT (DUF2867 family)